MKKRLTDRWSIIKRSRANIALLAAGCLLVLLSPIWRFAIAPAVKVVANDYDELYFYEGNMTTFVNAPSLPALPGGRPLKVPVIIEDWLFGRPHLSSGSVSTVEVTTKLFDRSTGSAFYTVKRLYPLDRKTGEIVSIKGVDRKRSGWYVVFPFDTPKGTIPVWVEHAGRTVPAKYSGEVTMEGLPLYRFKLEYADLEVEAPEGYPAELTGAQLKAMLSMPALPLPDSASLQAKYLASGRATILVEPKAGTVVEQKDVVASTSIRVDEQPTGPKLTQALSSSDYSQNRTSVSSAIEFAKGEVAKIRMQFLYIPLVFLVFGVLCMLGGAFAGIGALGSGKVVDEDHGLGP